MELVQTIITAANAHYAWAVSIYGAVMALGIVFICWVGSRSVVREAERNRREMQRSVERQEKMEDRLDRYWTMDAQREREQERQARRAREAREVREAQAMANQRRLEAAAQNYEGTLL